MRTLACAALALLAATALGCGAQAPTADYRQTVLQERVQRDMDMRSKGSVLPRAARASFRGLNYFPVDSAYRMTVPLERLAAPDTVLMAESTGGAALHTRVGHVAVPLPQGTERLAVFRAEDAPAGKLWIPFADATNGQTTYGAGRYVDVQLQSDGPGGDGPGSDSLAVVDFNRTYNPTCAYNPAYACPLPPDENRLAVAVPAGEKRPALGTY